VRDWGDQSLVVVLSSSVVQLSHNDFENRFFEGYKENSIEFSDQLLYYLYTLDYLSMFVLIYTTTIQEVGSLTPPFVILFIGPCVIVKVTHNK